MTVELTVTSITVQPEISAANVVITPTFTSGGGLTAPILSISKNGVNVEPDELKNVDIEVPTNTSDLTNDSNFVSDANYVHTDNNYDNEAVAEVAKIADKANSADVYTKSETYSQTEINNKLSAVYKYKGSVLTYDLLPIDAENADVWNVVNGITPELNGMNYAWNSTLSAWDAIGGIIGIATLTENGLMSKEDFKKLSDLYTKADLDLILADKSDVGHNHSGEGINPDYIVLDEEYTDLTMVALPVGALFYNVDQLSWLLKTSANTYLNLGEENTYIAKNGDNVTHLEGQVTYVTSGGGNLDVMTLASSANGKIDALLTQDVLHTGNGRGMYCFGGKVRTFPYSNVIKSTDNENTWIEGAELYLCSEAGRYSTTKEAAPAKCSIVGKITQRNGANISVSFRPFKAIALEDLSNVDGTANTLADTDEHLFKDVVTGLWKRITHSNLVTKLATWFYTKVLADRTFVNQNGGTIYHITRWFTPTSALTIAANGLSATITSGQFTSAMTGAKLKLTGGVNEPIITYVSTNQINLSFAVDSSFFGQSVAVANWGVYNTRVLYDGNDIQVKPYNGNYFSLINVLGYHYNRARQYYGIADEVYHDNIAQNFGSAYKLLFSSTTAASGTKDLGIRRISDGLMEIYNGVTNGVLRDLKLRSLFADKIAPNTTTGLKIGTVYNTSLTTATNNTAITSIAVQDTTGFPATGTILIGGVTSVVYTSKTTTSFTFASTVIPTYAVGTEVLVTSAGAYTSIIDDKVKTTKIIPNSDTTGVVIRNAADSADVVKVDTDNGAINLIESISNLAGLGFGSDVRFYRSGSGTLSLSMGGIDRMKWTIANGTGQFLMIGSGNAGAPKYSFNDYQNSGFYMPASTYIALSIAGVNAVNLGQKSGFGNIVAETTLDVNGTTTMRDWVYLNNGTHTGDAVGDRRFKVVSGVLTWERCTVAHATKGSGTWVNSSNQLSANADAANANNVGCQRYRSDANNSYFDVCMQTGASTYEWVEIKKNTW